MGFVRSRKCGIRVCEWTSSIRETNSCTGNHQLVRKTGTIAPRESTELKNFAVKSNSLLANLVSVVDEAMVERRIVGEYNNTDGDLLAEVVEREVELNALRTRPVPDIREQVLTSNDFCDILERMLDKDPGSRITSTELRHELTTLLDALNALPESVKHCLPHLRAEAASPSPDDDNYGESTAGRCLDLRSESRSDFTCRYLAKFANELTVPHLRITGGEIPLDIIRDPTTTRLELRDLSLASHDIMVVGQTLGGNNSLTSLDVHKNFIAYESEAAALSDPTKFELAGLQRGACHQHYAYAASSSRLKCQLPWLGGRRFYWKDD